jgi:hypothetical protein
VDIASQQTLPQYQVQVLFLAALMADQSKVLRKFQAAVNTENVKR